MLRRILAGVVLGLALSWGQVDLASAAVGEVDSYSSNLGVPGEVNQQNSANFAVDTVMDIVGGESTSSGGSGQGVQHGFHFLDEPASVAAKISKIVAVPEKREPKLNNNATYFLLEVYSAGADTTSVAPLWTSASYPAVQRLTDNTGTWVGTYDLALPAGGYDFYFTGLTTLKRRLAGQMLAAGDNELNFTLGQAAAATLPATATGGPLFNGDAAIAVDPDGSCAGAQATCVAYSGDEWGDNRVNSLDMSAINGRLMNRTPARIVKEDLNRDNIVNSLDMSIAQANLLRWGDR